MKVKSPLYFLSLLIERYMPYFIIGTGIIMLVPMPFVSFGYDGKVAAPALFCICLLLMLVIILVGLFRKEWLPSGVTLEMDGQRYKCLSFKKGTMILKCLDHDGEFYKLGVINQDKEIILSNKLFRDYSDAKLTQVQIVVHNPY